MKESNLQKQIRLALSRFGTYFRINVGSFQMADGRWFTTGTPKGYSDLTGFTKIEITPEMVGKTVAVYTAIEVKTATGRLSPEQENFLNHVKSHGGIAFVARSPKEIESQLKHG
jgi:hypothetical protein